MFRSLTSLATLACALLALPAWSTADEPTPSAQPQGEDLYADAVAPLFRRYCEGCHNDDDAEGDLSLESYGSLLRGGENGPVLTVGEPDKSRLLALIEGTAEPRMPPDDNEAPTAAEIKLLRRWIAEGARPPMSAKSGAPLLKTPQVKLLAPAREPITALAVSPNGRWLALGKHRQIEIRDTRTDKPIRTLGEHAGNVNDLVFSPDGQHLFAGAGEPGLFGEVTVWTVDGWKSLTKLRGHRDTIYALAVSPNGKTLATGSYDASIVLWDPFTAKQRAELTGHNGAVYDLAFHPSGKILGSAGGDAALKLWNPVTGERLDTLGQPTKAQYAIAFSPDGQHVVGGGVDNRIRIWRVRAMGREGTNPLLDSKFAHEGAITRLEFLPSGRVLVSASEDQRLKFWETGKFTQFAAPSVLPDWAAALAVRADRNALLVALLNGAFHQVSLPSEDAAVAAKVLPQILPATPVSSVTHDASKTLHELTELEPNNAPRQAQPVNIPAKVAGVLSAPEGRPDQDLVRFNAEAGETLVIETRASRDTSPADTKLEVLDAAGHLVQRAQLRAVRDSNINFRPIDSSQANVRVDNWEEMELNQFLYMEGEICKIFRMPEGPDSGFLFYQVNGKRRCYFGTSATVHPKDSPCYIVEAYSPTTELADNGLPIFPLYFTNDDAGLRDRGNDSFILFTAPANGEYLVRVSDVRGFSGEKFKYELSIRPPEPNFRATVVGKEQKVPKGSGRKIVFELDRLDGFEDEVTIEVNGLPEGWNISTPVTVEAGHEKASAVLTAAPNAEPITEEQAAAIQVDAWARIGENEVRHKIDSGLGKITLGDAPKVFAILERDTNATDPQEIVIEPGRTTTAVVRVERDGFNGELRFDVENLPHGVIVDNLGLNGIMVREGETHRQVFITAANWVKPTSRLAFAVARQEGNIASKPILIRVVKPNSVAQAGE